MFNSVHPHIMAFDVRIRWHCVPEPRHMFCKQALGVDAMPPYFRCKGLTHTSMDVHGSSFFTTCHAGIDVLWQKIPKLSPCGCRASDLHHHSHLPCVCCFPVSVPSHCRALPAASKRNIRSCVRLCCSWPSFRLLSCRCCATRRHFTFAGPPAYRRRWQMLTSF